MKLINFVHVKKAYYVKKARFFQNFFLKTVTFMR
jgi:hypothetical protein